MTVTEYVGFDVKDGEIFSPLIIFTSEPEVKKWCAVGGSNRRYKEVEKYSKFDIFLQQKVREIFP